MEAGFHLKWFGNLCECMWWPASLTYAFQPFLVDFGVSSIRLGSRHWEQKCFLEFIQFDVFSIGLICLNFLSCLLLCYSMLYRPSMIRHSKSQLRWWHHVKDPVTTPPAKVQAFHWFRWWQQHGLKTRLSKPIETSMWQGKLPQDSPVTTHSCIEFWVLRMAKLHIYESILTWLWLDEGTVEGITILFDRCARGKKKI